MLNQMSRIVVIVLSLAVVSPVTSLATTAQASVDEVMMHVGDVRTVIIHVDTGEVVDLYGAEARVSYDPAIVRPIAVRSALPIRLVWGNPVYNLNLNAEVAIAIAGANSVTHPLSLFEVDFEAVGLGISPLGLPKVILNDTWVADRRTGSANVVATDVVATEASSWSAVKRLY